MKIETYSLSDLFPGLGESRATVEAYWQTADDEIRVTERPAMVIFPGGGYAFTSHREAEPIALRFASLGYQCFVVWYSCKPVRHPLPLLEGAAAVAFVRRNAVKFGVDPRRIAVIGRRGHVFRRRRHRRCIAAFLLRQVILLVRHRFCFFRLSIL